MLAARTRADLVLKQMTLDEKIVMVHGVSPLPVRGYVGYIPANGRLGIPALTLADGRAGVGNGAREITVFPAPIAIASSWDVDLMERFGQALGQEQWTKGTNVVLAPSIDVVRVPEWGRTFESYGEDPYFNGQMAIAEIKGIQSQGPIADANMYLTMNQENNRMEEDSRVDERTLQEIYLPPFVAAIREGHVGTLMCAYVKTNRVYSCESEYLLNQVLRNQLNFDGWVMSDWGATHSTVDAANNGLDQEMPDGEFFGTSLKAAVSGGRVSLDVLNDHVRNILVSMFRRGLFDQLPHGSWSANARNPQHDRFARDLAEQGTVLLKNEGGILPLRSGLSIAVIGAAGSKLPKTEGGGSSAAITPYVVSPLDGVRKRLDGNANIVAADGSDLAAAAEVARKSDVAVVFANTAETEGADRPDLRLPGNQDDLIFTVAKANKNTIVVLDTGGPVLMPWIHSIAGLLEAWYPGQEDGNAIAAVLFGDVNPSGKLPLTFPRTADAIPTSSREQWPGVGGHSNYMEGLNVGYRWYDATHTQALFPFGFGLSYTNFHIGHLQLHPAATHEEEGSLTVTVDVTNTGTGDGAEVVQVYVGHPAADGEPPHQLRAFGKVELKRRETRIVSLKLDPVSFSTYDPAVHHWVYRPGAYEILVGDSSRHLPLRATVHIH